MRFEYILLLILSFLPIMYKIWYWEAIFRQQGFDIKKTFKYLKSKEGREYVFHFWLSLEIFFASFSLFYFMPLEILLFNAFFYLLLLYNVFVLWKILRGNIEHISLSFINIWVIWCTLFNLLWSILYDSRLIYLSISSILIFTPLYFIFILYIKKIIPST